ncbi:MAG: hypothetical protein JOY66_23155 [Acetobacteraceae bacterium]|nr:hypothetical protein [Acetobacteraceae bacterium]
MDWGTLVQRGTQEKEKGGWNVFSTFWAGLNQFNPVGHVFLRGNGKEAIVDWPTAPKIEASRQQWIDAADMAAQKRLAEALQSQALIAIRYVPLGQCFVATSYRKDITGILNGFVMFWNVRRV